MDLIDNNKDNIVKFIDFFSPEDQELIKLAMDDPIKNMRKPVLETLSEKILLQTFNGKCTLSEIKASAGLCFYIANQEKVSPSNLYCDITSQNFKHYLYSSLIDELEKVTNKQNIEGFSEFFCFVLELINYFQVDTQSASLGFLQCIYQGLDALLKLSCDEIRQVYIFCDILTAQGQHIYGELSKRGDYKFDFIFKFANKQILKMEKYGAETKVKLLKIMESIFSDWKLSESAKDFYQGQLIV